MTNRDSLHRFIFEDEGVRGELVQLDASYRATLKDRGYPPQVAEQLGECLAATSLLSATIKYQGSLILQAQSSGQLQALVAQATHDGTLRGLARWRPDLSADSSNNLFGEGRLVITLQPEKGEPYQGIVSLQSEKLSDSLEAYFEQSEQLRTRIWLAADQQTAVGLLLQVLPSKPFDIDVWERLSLLADTVTIEELLTLDAETLLYRLFHEMGVRLLDSSPLAFRCRCSPEKIALALRAIEREELDEILHAQGRVTVDCEFCNRHYHFDKVDLEALLSASVTSPPPTLQQ
jgi:molecular chaperone Hsp33